MFSAIYEELEYYDGADVVRDVLLPQKDAVREVLAAYQAMRSFRTRSDDFGHDASCSWYALGRVHDWLTLDAQRDLPGAATRDAKTSHARCRAGVNNRESPGVLPNPERPWRGPKVDASTLASFFSGLGFSPVETIGGGFRESDRAFHPFFHEIVELIEEPGASSSSISDVLWSGWMWGEMMFARAGVIVRCPPGLFKREQAVESTLYFAYDRLHRATDDLSHGWGHNSQWDTVFRRDYMTADAFHYNVDGDWLIEGGQPRTDDDRGLLCGLSQEARIELLRHRSLVRSSAPDIDDLYPYEDRHVESRVGGSTGAR